MAGRTGRPVDQCADRRSRGYEVGWARTSATEPTAFATSAWSCAPAPAEKSPLARNAKCSSSGPSTTPTSPTTPVDRTGLGAELARRAGSPTNRSASVPVSPRDREARVDRRRTRAAPASSMTCEQRRAGDAVVGREARAVVHHETVGRDTERVSSRAGRRRTRRRWSRARRPRRPRGRAAAPRPRSCRCSSASRRRSAESGAESTCAISRASAGALPRRTPPAIVTPRAASSVASCWPVVDRGIGARARCARVGEAAVDRRARRAHRCRPRPRRSASNRAGSAACRAGGRRRRSAPSTSCTPGGDDRVGQRPSSGVNGASRNRGSRVPAARCSAGVASSGSPAADHDEVAAGVVARRGW